MTLLLISNGSALHLESSYQAPEFKQFGHWDNEAAKAPHLPQPACQL